MDTWGELIFGLEFFYFIFFAWMIFPLLTILSGLHGNQQPQPGKGAAVTPSDGLDICCRCNTAAEPVFSNLTKQTLFWIWTVSFRFALWRPVPPPSDKRINSKETRMQKGNWRLQELYNTSGQTRTAHLFLTSSQYTAKLSSLTVFQVVKCRDNDGP